MILKRLVSRQTALAALLVAALLPSLLTISGAKRWSISPQIIEMFAPEQQLHWVYDGKYVSVRDPLAFQNAEPWAQRLHLVRKTVYYPIFVLSHFTQVDVDYLFTLYITALLLITCVFLSSFTDLALAPDVQPMSSLASYVAIFLALGLAMNGRLFFSFAAGSLLLWLDESSRKGQLTRPASQAMILAFVLWISSISSGLYSATYLAVVAWLVAFRPARHDPSRGGAIAFWLLMLPATLVFMMGVVRNFIFFGADIESPVKALSHGVGYLLMGLPVAVVFLLLICVAFALWRSRHAVVRLPAFMKVILLSSAFSGAFGIGSMGLAVPALAALLVVRMLAGRHLIQVPENPGAPTAASR